MSIYPETALLLAGFLQERCGEAFECYCPDCGTPLSDTGASGLSSLVDLNSATFEELDRLPQIGDTYANRIINCRPYQSVEELRRVKGMKESIFSRIQPLVTVGGEGALPTAKSCAVCMVSVSSPFTKCGRCRERLPVDTTHGERDCLSVQAFRRSDCNLAFAPKETLWVFKKETSGPLEVAAESDLRRRFASGELAASALVRGASRREFINADACPEFRDVARLRPAPEPVDPLWEYRALEGWMEHTVHQSELVQRFLDGRLHAESRVRKAGCGLFVLAGRHPLFTSIARPRLAPQPATPVPALPDLAHSARGKARLLGSLIVLLLAIVYWGVILPDQRREEEARQTEGARLEDEQAAADRARPSDTRIETEKGKDFQLSLPEGDTLEMIWISPGSFEMGTSENEAERVEDEKQHSVTLGRGYWLGKYEVTQGQWENLMGNNPSRFKGRKLPVDRVSWEECVDFCKRLNEREMGFGRLPSGYAYGPPSEAQWENACRAGTTGAYAGELDAMGWYDRNSGSKTHEVGLKQENGWGFYDMHGNVSEWCSDWHGDYPSGSVRDPRGPSTGFYRVYRGGSWNYDARNCRSASRDWNTPSLRFSIGFRLCLRSDQRSLRD